VREYCGLPKVSSYSQLNNTIGKEEEKDVVRLLGDSHENLKISSL
jgi:hypothetical protein